MAEAAGATVPDCERFRLRGFLTVLARAGELQVVAEPIDLVDVAARLDGYPHAVLLRRAAAEEAQRVGNVMGSRRRLALAFDVGERELLAEVLTRVRTPIPPVEVASAAAPVHQVVRAGPAADFTALPAHLQHGEDGAPYISAGIDISRSFDGKRRNVGFRRLMLRGRREAGIDLVAPSDLKSAYGEFVACRERMPMAFVVGAHPADAVAAVGTWSPPDEVAIMGALRGAPVPLVRCVSIDAFVPADAEFVLEGYLDERGWSEPEGPYGEFFGYYGPVKINPVFHLTAITARRDALFQTLTIGGRDLAMTDTAQLNTVRTEAAAWSALLNGVREPVAVYAPPATGGVSHLRVALRQRHPGEARNAIVALFGSLAELKHVFVVDPDIDIFSDAQVEWALATRFQADRDLIVVDGLRAIPIDPSLAGRRTTAKAGFDLTLPLDEPSKLAPRLPQPPTLGPARGMSVVEALREGPKTFRDLMEATGSRDGRDLLAALDEFQSQSRLERRRDGRYALAGEPP